MDAIVIEFRFFNRILKKKKKKKENNMKNLGKLLLGILHTTSNFIKFFIGVNFNGDLHLDVSRC